MKLTPLKISISFFLFLVLFAAVASEGKGALSVSGIIKGSNGEYFATVRGHGLVKEGQVLTNRASRVIIQIEKITPSDVKYKTLRAAVKETPKDDVEQPPDPKKPPKDYDPNDPFLPIGFSFS